MEVNVRFWNFPIDFSGEMAEACGPRKGMGEIETCHTGWSSIVNRSFSYFASNRKKEMRLCSHTDRLQTMLDPPLHCINCQKS